MKIIALTFVGRLSQPGDKSEMMQLECRVSKHRLGKEIDYQGKLVDAEKDRLVSDIQARIRQLKGEIVSLQANLIHVQRNHRLAKGALRCRRIIVKHK